MGCETLACCILLLPLLLHSAQAAYSYVYVGNYYYQTYYYTTYYYTPYVSIGTIIGSVIGALSFTAFVIGVIVCVCCVRRRRMMATQRAAPVAVPMTTTVVNGVPVATVSGEAVSYGYNGSQFPPPYPYPVAGGAPGNQQVGYQLGPQPPQGADYTGQLPYPQQQQQPYPQQQQSYPPPAYQPGAQDEHKF